ncbi:PadR family transcriptional regulator [Actinomadura sp. NBRC 104412]|uniref:PadR family transcriptional regulator n=1 Tax=Actinomadura sp. NBRC 104412 TaxID=3032203 RepID=UPI00249FC710|nr:PadR family transcriptional regulator [Actinomadura sp. NBRC 104412]GLZ04798.1 PadR family transcriptional regulator [Actinomadura sp. NBRC 104412]
MSLRHAVLGLIVQVPGCSGYDLLKIFEISLAHVWQATQSQIYGELGKLAADGLIEVASEGPRGRKEYAPTEAGRDELRRWLTGTPPRRVTRDEALLRVFFLGSIPHDQAREYLRREADDAAAGYDELVDLEHRLNWTQDTMAEFGRIALEFGQRYMATRRDWARWALTQLEARSRETT